MPNLTQLRLEECPFSMAKRMEYDYRIYDGDKCVYAWHEMSKQNYTEILLKRSGAGYMRTDDINNAVAVARYPIAEHYAREAEKAAEYVKAEDLKVDGEGLIIGGF